MRALVTAPFSEKGLALLRDAGLEVDYCSWLSTGKLHMGPSLLTVLNEGGHEIVVIEGDEVKEDVIEGSRLKMIACVRNNPNNVSISLASKKGIPVLAAPGRNTLAVAELTVALILSQARRIVPADRLLHGEFYVDDFSDFARMYNKLMGFELNGRVAGIVGLGAIGLEVAKRLNALGMRILAYDPYVDKKRASTVSARLVDLETLMRESDVVTVHCAPTDETKGMIGRDQFAIMKHDAIFINTARASITDEQALFDALKSGRIAGAGLDVFSMEPVDSDNIFLGLDNVTVTPHMGGNTAETIERQSDMIAHDIIALLKGGKPRGLLNPEVIR